MSRNLGNPGSMVLVGRLRASAINYRHARLRRIADFWLMQIAQGAVIALAGLAILGLAFFFTR